MKLEGGAEIAPMIKKIVAAGIPVCGHLGLTPQSVHQFGGYGLRAKEEAEAEKLKAEAERVKAKTNKTNAQQTQSASGWAIPTAEPKKTEVKKVEKNANGAVLKADAKYMEGSITTNAEGKVEFTLDTDANGKSADEIYNIVYQYMSDLTQGENNIKSRMALVNKDQHIIANTMDEWLVFSNTFLSLDRSEFRYNLVASIKDNHLTLSMERLYYVYEEDRSTGFKAPAEEIINDKIALNKKKTDLAKIFGKFRTQRSDFQRNINIGKELIKPSYHGY